jgi:hypothetical protein
MGVECTAMTYAGKWVEDPEEYLVSVGVLKEGQLQAEFDGDFEYAMGRLKCPLQVQPVSYYSNQGAYVGFETYASNYKDFDGLITRFHIITGDVAEVCTFEHWH